MSEFFINPFVLDPDSLPIETGSEPELPVITRGPSGLVDGSDSIVPMAMKLVNSGDEVERIRGLNIMERLGFRRDSFTDDGK